MLFLKFISVKTHFFGNQFYNIMQHYEYNNMQICTALQYAALQYTTRFLTYPHYTKYTARFVFPCTTLLHNVMQCIALKYSALP